MLKCLVVGNWKMHGTRESTTNLLKSLCVKAQENKALFENVRCCVLPPSIFLAETETILKGSDIYWGAQDVSQEIEGAFTGQISARMLKEFGCYYTLVGHSERRQINRESDDLVAEKYWMAQQMGLIPILCVGETQAERESGKTKDVLARQLLAVLQKAKIESFNHAVLAYEPVWAIGTGLAATPEMAEDVHAFCRHFLTTYNAAIANGLTIIYGGSVKVENTEALLSQPNINGVLVGGASLDSETFWKIAMTAARKNFNKQ